MADTLSQAFNLGQDQQFIQRVTDALLAYAYTVETEAGTVPNHAARQLFANKVVLTPDPYGAELARLIAAVDTNAAGGAYIGNTPFPGPDARNVTDAQITADVVTGFNLLAGI